MRTHTSSVQIRALERLKPPLAIVAPGRVYRRDTPDATHNPEFHQVGVILRGGLFFSWLVSILLLACIHSAT